MKAWWTLPFLLLTGASVEAAVSAPVAAQTETTLPDSIVTTRHRVTVGGRALAYAARAGLIPIRDNEATWLDQSDLVFVDPVGTGYSRPTKPEYGPEFYQTRGDAESVAEFIRVYRVRFDAMDAPLFIAGESYGTIRDAHVADVLARRGIPLRGAILAALAIPLG